MNIQEWIKEKKETEFRYFGCCYMADIAFPFGFCKECWIKAGKPMEVKA
tara:strand:- start:537 stop:683 length:147 start_codon:yes stop_codon:yes gene_type:complete